MPSVIDYPAFSPKDGGYCRGSAPLKCVLRGWPLDAQQNNNREVDQIEEWDTLTAPR
jgi:hypothetical protein